VRDAALAALRVNLPIDVTMCGEARSA